MDGGAYAPIVSRILKSGRWVGSDGEEVSAGAIGVESQYLWRKISVRSVGVGERRRFPPPDAGNNRGLPPITSGKTYWFNGHQK